VSSSVTFLRAHAAILHNSNMSREARAELGAIADELEGYQELCRLVFRDSESPYCRRAQELIERLGLMKR